MFKYPTLLYKIYIYFNGIFIYITVLIINLPNERKNGRTTTTKQLNKQTAATTKLTN